jgi:hypothetical protein
MTETPTHDAPTEAEILELERLLSRATTRPWRHDVIESLGKNWLLSSSFGEDPDGTRPILTTDSIAGLDAYCAPPSDDIKAIAAVMNAAPRLLQAARQQTVATRPQGREELRAQHAAMLEMQDPLARTLLAVRDALQSLPEDALGEGESGGACWPLRDELLTGVEHCLKLQRELKERSDTLAILSLPPQSLPVEVSDQAAIMALCERERIFTEVTGDDYVDPVLEFARPEYGEDGAGLQHEIAMMKRMIGEAYICDAIEPRPVKVKALDSLPSWGAITCKVGAGERLTALEELIYEEQPADDCAADLFRDLLLKALNETLVSQLVEGV